MHVLIQNLHLTQSEPRKIDPMCTPDAVRGSHSESEEATQILSTSGLLITVLAI